MAEYKDGVAWCERAYRRANAVYGVFSEEADAALVVVGQARAHEAAQMEAIDSWVALHLRDFIGSDGKVKRSTMFNACVRALGLGHGWEQQIVILSIRATQGEQQG